MGGARRGGRPGSPWGGAETPSAEVRRRRSISDGRDRWEPVAHVFGPFIFFRPNLSRPVRETGQWKTRSEARPSSLAVASARTHPHAHTRRAAAARYHAHSRRSPSSRASTPCCASLPPAPVAPPTAGRPTADVQRLLSASVRRARTLPADSARFWDEASVLGYWRASRTRTENVLFLRYDSGQSIICTYVLVEDN